MATAAQWAAVRALLEGNVPDFTLAARAVGVTERTVERRAGQEGWAVTAIAEEDIAARIRRMMSAAVVNAEAAMAHQSETGGLDKTRVEAVSVILKLVERLADMDRGMKLARQQSARAAQALSEDAEGLRGDGEGIAKANDAEIGTILARIDRKIVELARAYAQELTAEAGRGAARNGEDVAGAR